MDEKHIQIRFVDYIHSMYEHIKHAYGNPPVIVNFHQPLCDAVMDGVPPKDIGDEWFHIALGVFVRCCKWSDKDEYANPKRVYPSPEQMEQFVIDNWRERI